MSGVRIDFKDNALETNRRLDRLSRSLESITRNSRVKVDIGGDLSSKIKKINGEVATANTGMLQAGRVGTEAFGKVDKSAAKSLKSVNLLGTAIKGLALAFSAIFTVSVVNTATDNLVNVQNRLRLIIRDADKLATAQSRLFGIAREARSEFADAVNLFVDFQQALGKKGVSDRKIEEAVSTVLKAGVLSGTGRSGIKGALVQLTQGIASGTLRGEELNSVMEQMKFLGLGLMDILDKDAGALRRFAEEGKLSTELLLEVLEQLKGKADAAFSELEIPVALAVSRLKASISKLTGELSQRFNFSQSFVGSIEKINKSVDGFAENFNGKILEFKRNLKEVQRTIRASRAEGASSRNNFATKQTAKVLQFSDKNNPVERASKGLGLPTQVSNFFAETAAVRELKLARMEENVELLKKGAVLEAIRATLQRNVAIQEFAEAPVRKTTDALLQLTTLLRNTGSVVTTLLSQLSNIAPTIAVPIATVTAEIDAAVSSSFVNLSARIRDAMLQRTRGIEAIADRMSFFVGIDRRVDRALLGLFRTTGIDAFNRQLLVLRDALATDFRGDIPFLGRELEREFSGTVKFFRELGAQVGLLENSATNIVDLPVERIEQQAARITRALKRVFTDIFQTQVTPVIFESFKMMEKRLNTLNNALRNSFNPATGRTLGKRFGTWLLGLVTGFSRAFAEGRETLDIAEILAFSGVPLELRVALLKDIGDALKSVGLFLVEFGKTLAVTLTAPIFNALERVVRGLFARLSKAISSQKARLTTAVSSLLKGVTAFDGFTGVDLGGVFAPFIKLFKEIPEIARRGLRSTLNILRSFAVAVKAFFHDIWKDVVGSSTWPDTIDGVIAHTGRLSGAEKRIGSFAQRVKAAFLETFQNIRELPIGDIIGSLVAQLSALDLTGQLASVSETLLSFAVAALGLAFGNTRIKLIAATSLGALLTDALGASLDNVTEALNKLGQRLVENLAPILFQAFKDALVFLVANIPVFIRSIADSITPLLGGIFDIITTFSFIDIGMLVGGILTAIAMFTTFSAEPRKTLGEIFFGRRNDDGKQLTRGIFGVIGALFGLSKGGLILNGRFLGLAIAAAVSTTIEGVGVLEAAIIGIPALFAAVFGPAAGARLFVSLFRFLEGGFISVIALLARTRPIKAAIDAFGRNFGALFATATSSQVTRKTRRAFNQAAAQVLTDLRQLFRNMRANAEAYSEGRIGLLDSFFNTRFDGGAMRVNLRRSIGNLFRTAVDLTNAHGVSLRQAWSSVTSLFSNGVGGIAARIRAGGPGLRRSLSGFSNILSLGLQGIAAIFTSKLAIGALVTGLILSFSSGAEAAGLSDIGLEETVSSPFKALLAVVLGLGSLVSSTIGNISDGVVGMFKTLTKGVGEAQTETANAFLNFAKVVLAPMLGLLLGVKLLIFAFKNLAAARAAFNAGQALFFASMVGPLTAITRINGLLAGFAALDIFVRAAAIRMVASLRLVTLATVFNAGWWLTRGAAITAWLGLFRLGVPGAVAALAGLARGVLFVLGPFAIFAKLAAAVTVVALVASILFGKDGNGDEEVSKMDLLIDKARVLAGITPESARGRRESIIQKFGVVEIQKIKFDIEPLLFRVDFEKFSKGEFQRFDGFLDDGLKLLRDIQLEVLKTGVLTTKAANEAAKIAADIKSLVQRQRQRDVGDISTLRDSARAKSRDIFQSFIPKATPDRFKQLQNVRGRHSARALIMGVTTDNMSVLQRAARAHSRATAAVANGISNAVVATQKWSVSLGRLPYRILTGLNEVPTEVAKRNAGNVALKQRDPDVTRVLKLLAQGANAIQKRQNFLPEGDVANVAEMGQKLKEAVILLATVRNGNIKGEPLELLRRINAAERVVAKFEPAFRAEVEELKTKAFNTRAANALSERMEKFAEDVKTVLEIDFGEKGLDFFGDGQELGRIQMITDAVRRLDEAIPNATTPEIRVALQIDKARLKLEAESIAESLPKVILLKTLIEFQVKELDIEGAEAGLRRLSFTGGVDSRQVSRLVKLLKQAEVASLKSTASPQDQQAVADDIERLRAGIISRLPFSEVFESINLALKSTGVKELTEVQFLKVDPSVFVAVAASVDKIRIARLALAKVAGLQSGDEASREAQTTALLAQRNAVVEGNRAIRSGLAAVITEIAGDASLTSFQQMAKITEQLGETIPEAFVLKPGGIGEWVRLKAEVTALTARMLTLSELAASGDAVVSEAVVKTVVARIEAINTALTDTKKATDDAVKGVNDMLSALNLADMDTTALSVLRLPSGERGRLAGIATEISSITDQLNKVNPASKSFETLARRREALIGQARAFNKALTFNNGKSIQTALESIGLVDKNAFQGSKKSIARSLTDTSRLVTLGPNAIQDLIDADVELKALRFQIGRAGDVEEFLNLRTKLFEGERNAAFAVDDISTTLPKAIAEINEVFKSDLDIFSFTTVAPQARRFLTETAKFFKRELANLEASDETLSGLTVEAFAKTFRQVLRAGEYLTFFQETQVNLETALIEGAKSSLERISNLSGIKFADVDLQLFKGNRQLAVELTNLDAFEQALNLPGLTSEMAAVLDNVNFSDLDSTMALFKRQFGVSLKELNKTPLEQHSTSLDNLRLATEKLTAAYLGKSFEPTALVADLKQSSVTAAPSPGDIRVTASATGRDSIVASSVTNLRVDIAKLATSMRAVSAETDLRGRAGLLSSVAGVQIPPDVLNRATTQQLERVATLAEKIAERSKQVLELRLKGLPTEDLQAEIDRLTFELNRIPERINGASVAIQAAGVAFAGSIDTMLRTALGDAAKGKDDVFKTLLDGLTNQIIDTFIKGLTDPLTGKNGVLTDAVSKLGEGIGGTIAGLFTGASDEDVAAGGVSAVGTYSSSFPSLDSIGFGSKTAELSKGGVKAPEDTFSMEALFGIETAVNNTNVVQEGLFTRLGGVFADAWSSLGSMLSSMFGGGASKGGKKDVGAEILGWLSVGVGIASSAASMGSAGSGTTFDANAGKTGSFDIRRATGGPIFGKGTGTSDSILARLSNGEFVINAKSAAKNFALLSMINQDRLPAFAAGGVVGSATPTIDTIADFAADSTNGDTSSGQQVFNINVTGDISRQTRSEISRMIPVIAGNVNKLNKERRLT